MKLFEKFKKAFGAEPKVLSPGSDYTEQPKVEITDDPPIQPGKIDMRHLMRALHGGFRLPPRTRIYRKRPPKLVVINHEVVRMGHRAAKLLFIHTGMREANEIRRSFRERQLEARAERAAA